MPDLSLYQIIFYLAAFLAVGSALFILLTKNIFYAAISLVLSLLSVAMVYVIARADFIAITQIMIYVGGVLVLLAFGLMISNRKEQVLISGSHNKITSFLLCGSLLFILTKLITKIIEPFSDKKFVEIVHMKDGSLEKIGMSLMTDYVFVFEFAGVLLLLALIAATYISAKSNLNYKNTA